MPEAALGKLNDPEMLRQLRENVRAPFRSFDLLLMRGVQGKVFSWFGSSYGALGFPIVCYALLFRLSHAPDVRAERARDRREALHALRLRHAGG